MAPIVLLSVRWDQVRDALAGLPPWDGRILIDATNAVGAGFRPVDLGPRTSSEVVASLAPGARVVKGGNTLPRALLAADASQSGGRRVLFLSGDDAAAKADVSAVFSSMGFAPIDVGDLPAGGRLHQVPGGALTALNLIKLG
jgi:predicted dinucleotide-binding enzyme